MKSYAKGKCMADGASVEDAINAAAPPSTDYNEASMPTEDDLGGEGMVSKARRRMAAMGGGGGKGLAGGMASGLATGSQIARKLDLGNSSILSKLADGGRVGNRDYGKRR